MPSNFGFLAAAAFLPAAFAHYNFEALIVNGNVTDPYEYVRQTNNSNSPITDITSLDMRCNAGGLGECSSGPTLGPLVDLLMMVSEHHANF